MRCIKLLSNCSSRYRPQVVSFVTLVCPNRVFIEQLPDRELYDISAALAVAPCSQGARGSSLEEADVSQRDDAQHAEEDDVGQHDEQAPASEAVLVAEHARDELGHARQLRRRGLQQQQEAMSITRSGRWNGCRRRPALSFPHGPMHGVVELHACIGQELREAEMTAASQRLNELISHHPCRRCTLPSIDIRQQLSAIAPDQS